MMCWMQTEPLPPVPLCKAQAPLPLSRCRPPPTLLHLRMVLLSCPSPPLSHEPGAERRWQPCQRPPTSPFFPPPPAGEMRKMLARQSLVDLQGFSLEHATSLEGLFGVSSGTQGGAGFYMRGRAIEGAG